VTAHEAYPLTTCSPNSGDRAGNGGHDVAGSHGPVHLRHPERVLPVRSWSSATRPTQMTPYVSCSRTPSETVLTAFGVTSLTFLRVRELILRLGREKPRWGYMRIRGELLKLGIRVSATTIATVLRRSGLGTDRGQSTIAKPGDSVSTSIGMA
jgi:hypothetical protein